jgi:hypothetical protein
LLPFVAGAAGLWLADEPHRETLLALLRGYAAVILSFMGAIHWGLAMRPAAVGTAGPGRSMTLSVLPALLAWVALSLPPGAGLVAMGVGFAGVYWMDARAIAAGEAPPWYRRLRVPLTWVVLICLAVAVAALALRGPGA